ncbi:MAG TPA: hypothetical protein VKE49_04330 [Myxococcaceae bacterium]|nr:hypothetical protein [Myxococcaceae bacterium]
MKRLNTRFALILASALGLSAVAHADTLPAGAVRFSVSVPSDPFPIDVAVPKGQTLVITDIVVSTGIGCDFLDGSERKITALRSPSEGTLHISFQTGLAFNTELRSDGMCSYITLSGYWINAS